MMTKRGIEPNTEKVNAITKIQSSHLVKDVQNLIGRLVPLSHFLSKFADKSLPFFNILKKAEAFEWIEE